MSQFLESVASEARILAEIWFELLELYRTGSKVDAIPEDLAAKIRKTSHNQVSHFGELELFYSYHIAEKYSDLMNGEFVKAMTELLSKRERCRDILGRRLVVKDWLREPPNESKVDSLESAVLAIQSEAARLSGLAKACNILQ
jgi:hypothetical protein